jgi:LisH domain-containing protein ARMC9
MVTCRRSAQSEMNKENTIEYLHTLLERLDVISDYSMEYGAALFMNLCLRTKGRKHCLQDPGRTLDILSGLIEQDNAQVKQI